MTRRRCIAFSSYTGNRCRRPVGSTVAARAFCTCDPHVWGSFLADPRVDPVRQHMSVDPWDHVLILVKKLEALDTDGARIVAEALEWTRF